MLNNQTKSEQALMPDLGLKIAEPKITTKLSLKLGILCHMGQEQIHARCTIKLSHSQEEQAHCCFFRMGNQWPNVGFDYF